MLELKNVFKSYDGVDFQVEDVSFKVESGTIFGFLGPNGAGKTTTIKMITSMLAKDKGDIIINGVNIEDDAMFCKRQICYIPDNPEVYERLKGIEYLTFLANVYDVNKEDFDDRIKKYSEAFDLANNLNDFITTYSHGMKQKLVLIGALTIEPKIFILDEPMVGLDPKSSYTLKELMREHCNKGNIVFFSTHVLEVAEKLCDEVAIINKGKIIATGSVEDIKKGADSSLEEIFLELTE